MKTSKPWMIFGVEEKWPKKLVQEIHVTSRIVEKSMLSPFYFLILRTFTNRSLEFMKFSWKTYVQPIADYCSQLWGPSHGSDLKWLENTLKSFTSKIQGIKHLNYWERLKVLKMYSMGRRMEWYRILYIYKIITGKVQNCGITWTNNTNSGTIITEIEKKKYFQSQRENSFHYAAPRLFNRLPRTLRDDRNSTIDEWKDKLYKILTNIVSCHKQIWLEINQNKLIIFYLIIFIYIKILILWVSSL